MNDITSKSDIKIFIDAFYGKVKIDPLIGPVFAAAIPGNDWSVHMERMYSFWDTVLFAKKDYQGSPFSKHSTLPLEKKHFDRWINLFAETLDAYFVGEKTEEAKDRAVKMGALFLSKLQYMRDNPQLRNLE